MSRLGPFIHVVRFILLVLVQGLVISEIDLGRNTHPMLYVLFILLLPIEMPTWLTMLLSFVYGLFLDWFASTPGMHISACVFLAASRPIVLRILSPREGYEFGMEPGIQMLGLRWFLAYAGISIFVHHIWYFLVEKLSFSNLGDTLIRASLSTIASLLLVILVQYLFYRQTQRT